MPSRCSYGKRTGISGFFRSLIADPADALSNFNPERIVFLRGRPDDPDPDTWRPVFIGPPEGPDDPIVYKMIKAGDVRSAMRQPGSPEGQRRSIGKTDVFEIDEEAVIDAGARGAELFWLFKPYVRRAEAGLVSAFESEAARLLGWPWGSFRKAVASGERPD